MKRYKNILLVHDSRDAGQTTLSRAIDLAVENKARLKIIQVINQIPNDYRMLITSVPPDEIMQLSVLEHTRHLENYIAPFNDLLEIEVKVVVGREFIEIIKEVLCDKHDLVLKTARGMGGTIEMLFGSTAMHLLRKCPCAVWMMKPATRQPSSRIMAAVDVVSQESEENDLNRKIIELAISMAVKEKSELHIVHAWEKPYDSLFVGGFDYYPKDINELVKESKNTHVERLDNLLNQYDLQYLQCHKHVLQGWADKVIPEFAEQNQIDLVVMGTVSRTGISGFFIGNTAEKILYTINCSVLAVKPEGFVSPVQLDK